MRETWKYTCNLVKLDQIVAILIGNIVSAISVLPVDIKLELVQQNTCTECKKNNL